MLLACLLATLATASQDPPPEPTLAERVERAIEKSNAYERFDATYRIAKEDGATGEMRLVYRAPDHGLFEMKQGKGGMRQFIVGGTIDVRARKEDGTESTMTVRSFAALPRLSESARGWIEEYFPGKKASSESKLASGELYNIDVGADGDKLNISVNVGTGVRLGWLAMLQRDPEHVSVSGKSKNEVAYSRGKTRLEIDLDSGFVTKIEADVSTGKIGMTLASVDLEAPADDVDLDPPAPAPGAEDNSKPMEFLSWVAINEQVRGIVHGSLVQRFDAQQLEWNEATRAKVEKLFRRVDEELVATSLASMIASTRDWIDTTAEKTQEQLAAGGPEVLERLRAGLDAGRSGLEKQLREIGQKYFAEKPHARACKLRPTLGEDLLALEEPILLEICQETVGRPLLASFDEKVGKQLEAK